MVYIVIWLIIYPAIFKKSFTLINLSIIIYLSIYLHQSVFTSLHSRVRWKSLVHPWNSTWKVMMTSSYLCQTYTSPRKDVVSCSICSMFSVHAIFILSYPQFWWIYGITDESISPSSISNPCFCCASVPAPGRNLTEHHGSDSIFAWRIEKTPSWNGKSPSWNGKSSSKTSMTLGATAVDYFQGVYL